MHIEAIEAIEAYFGQALPSFYRAFLQTYTEEMTEEEVYLYLPEDVIERNEIYEVKTYAAGYINIGDNGGGQAFILKLKGDDPEVSIVDHGSMDPACRELVCESFSQWLTSGFEYGDD